MLTGIMRTTVLVDDQQAALEWYRTVLGFEVRHDSEVDGFRYLHIGVPGQRDAGLWLTPAAGTSAQRVGHQTGGEPLLVLATDDLDRVVAHLEDHDVETWDVRDDGDSRSLHLRDVAGNVLVVAQLRDEA
jgi:catechol 2,3-dioxygenase-like lactoylglutathione lyase family enzyme